MDNQHSRTFYDVLQILKRFGIYVHLGNRLWDIEMAEQEFRDLYQHRLITREEYLSGRLVLIHEHELEEAAQRQSK